MVFGFRGAARIIAEKPLKSKGLIGLSLASLGRGEISLSKAFFYLSYS